MKSILPLDRWTIVDAVRVQAERYGERPFATFMDATGTALGQLTFAGLDRESDVVASALARLGVEPEDRVLALISNSAEFLITMVATHKRRAIFAPINTELKGAFLEHQVRNSEPKVMIVDDSLLERFRDVNIEGVGVEHLVVLGDQETKRPLSLAAPNRLSWTELVTLGAGADPADSLTPEPWDICTIMYTSGTTGPAKGVLMPQGHNLLFAINTATAMRLTEDDRYYCAMPLFHANGLYMQVWAAHCVGATVSVVKRFSTSSWLDEVIASGATVTNALGVMPEFIYRSPEDPRDRETALTRVLAIPVADEWGLKFEERFGVRVLQGFGMTEVNMPIWSDWDDPVQAGCAGRVVDEFFEVIVADPNTDLPLPAKAIGEILVRPKRPFFFSAGYFKMPDKTVEAWRNLWFHTGDAAYFDDQDRLHFVDRLKDRIRRRGENVSSYEVEQVINEYPGVAESAAVGIRVEGAGGEEEIKVGLVMESGAPALDHVDLLEFCVPRMPRFAIPRFLEVVDELDKTASGKIRKQAMRDGGITPDTWDRDTIGWAPPR